MSGEAKHTPGPWRLAPGDRTGFKTASGGESILADARPTDNYFVLKIAEMDTNVQADERRANARLIAAAPDLLEALQDIERLAGTRHGEDLADAVDAIWRIAGSAIAKTKTRDAQARGEHP